MKGKMLTCNMLCCIMGIITGYAITNACIHPENLQGDLFVGGFALIAAVIYHLIGKNA